LGGSIAGCGHWRRKKQKPDRNVLMIPIKLMKMAMGLWLFVPSALVMRRVLMGLCAELSEKGKVHDQECKMYNQQAAEFVFRANNAMRAPDEIDLHGL
jgi:hypothetical protein